jgi:hypothetical protein
MRGLRRRPYVQVQTVLAHLGRLAGFRADEALYALGRELVCRSHARPLRCSLRRAPALIAHGWCRKGDAFVDSELAFVCALK